MGDERWYPADRTGLFLDVEQSDVAFGRGIELEDLRNAEALLERRPDVRPQPVAAAESQPGRVRRRRRGIEQIAAELADVLEDGAAVAPDVVPERRGGKSIADEHRAAIDQHRSGRHRAADAVIHRQAVIHAVVWPRVHHAGEPVGPVHQPEMADDRGLRQSGGAGRVDEECAVIEGHLDTLLAGERGALEFRDRLRDVGKCRIAVAVRPHHGRGGDMRRGGSELIEQLARYDDVSRRDGVDRTGKRGSDEMGVEQRDGSARPADADPHRHIFRSVRHQQADGVPLAHPVGHRPARVAVRSLIEQAEGEDFRFRNQSGGIAEALGELLHHDWEGASRMPGERRRHLERSQPRLRGRAQARRGSIILP